jgi:3',5'-cyclic AMP phosphodiesterase CpdA
LSLLAQLSDPHVDVGPGDTGSAAALTAAVRAVLRLDPAPDAVLVSGDVANRADAASYERAAELLAPLPMPVHVLPGNHDDRGELRAAFRAAAVDGAAHAPYRWAVRCGGLRLVGCDTTIPGHDGGQLDTDALAWLVTTLDDDLDTPTILAMHHPPIEIGIGALDAIGLPPDDRWALSGLLETSPRIRRVVCGHVHRAAAGELGGVGVFTCPSVYLHARLELGGDPGGEIVLEPGAPAFGLHALMPDTRVVSHVEPVRR